MGTKYGDKYSGGLGTYTANHRAIAIYSEQADRTFFVYGGTKPSQKHLLVMASFYDHSICEWHAHDTLSFVQGVWAL